jgi:outer membrane protein assembly factor BamA
VYKGAPPQDKKTIERMANRAQSAIADSVEVVLRNEGYLDASARTEDSHLVVTAGPLYRIDSVGVTGDSSFSIAFNELFNEDNLQRLTDNILRQYYDRGYYWASIKVDQVRKRGGRVHLDLRIIKGPRVQLGGTVYTGLVRSESELVERYIPVQTGDTLTDALVHRAEAGAAGIPFVTFHAPVAIRPHEGYTRADLGFRFSEKRQLTFEAGGGYIPDDATGLVWHLNLNFNNLFGGGKQAAILSERREKGRNALRIKYRQPLFIAGIGSLHLQAGTRDYRQQFYEVSLEGGYTTQLGRNISTGLGLGWKRVQPSVTLPDYSRFTTQFSIEREVLDSRVNPANGLHLTWTVSYSYRRYTVTDPALAPERQSFNETHTAVSFKWYKRAVGILVGHLSLDYVGLETNESLPPISELVFLGGPGTIRGFRNEQFTALRAAFGTIEPRLRFSNGYLFSFYDAAYLNNRVSDLSNTDGSAKTQELYRYGYGVGLAFHDPYRSVKLSLGWNPELPFDQPRLSVEFSSDI